MSLDIEALEQSFWRVELNGDTFATDFYRHLFNDNPEVKPLFEATNMDRQKKKLLAAIKLVVHYLRRPEVLVPVLEEMGADHAEFGVTEEHYPAVGSALLKSLQQVYGAEWDHNLESLWTAAYQEIATHMLNGAAVDV